MTLPVFQTIRQAYAALWRHKASLLRFATLPTALAFAAILSTERMLVAFPDMTELESLGALLCGLAFVPFVVQAYRLFLLGTGDRSCTSWYWLGSGYLGVLALTVVFWLLLEVPAYAVGGDVYSDLEDVLFGEAPGDRYLAIVVFLAGVGLYTFLSIRLAFLFPSLSLGERLNLASSWRETRGCFWRLFVTSTLAILPLLVVVVIVAAAAAAAAFLSTPGFPDGALNADVGSEVEVFGFTESVVVAGTVVLLGLAAGAAAVAVYAVAYARLTGFPAQGLKLALSER